MKIGDMVPADARDETLSRMRRLGKGEKLEPFRFQRRARNGEILDVWLTISALVDESGRAYAVSTIERQIQNRKSSDTDDRRFL